MIIAGALTAREHRVRSQGFLFGEAVGNWAGLRGGVNS
jgi:hypothetical protein